MKKNQKYSKEKTCPSGRQVYLAIEIWQESGVTQAEFASEKKYQYPLFIIGHAIPIT